MLGVSGVKYGRFTSPHLLDRWDSINIGGIAVDEYIFRRTENRFQEINRNDSIGASEFEILTATAFSIFEQNQVDVGIIEAGLGGREDATNVVQNPLVTVITKIGMDHQRLLGNSLEEIASHKAGIMKSGSPCLADGTNDEVVCRILRLHAKESNVPLLRFVPSGEFPSPFLAALRPLEATHAPYQISNAHLSLAAVQLMLHHLGRKTALENLVAAVKDTSWPGRLQFLDLDRPLPKRRLLLDGAHNRQAAHELGRFVDHRLRQMGANVTWLVAISKGRDPGEILRELLRPGDKLLATSFGSVDHMPWVAPVATEELVACALSSCSDLRAQSADVIIPEAFDYALETAGEGPLVITGSLYLVADILRLGRWSSVG